MCSDDIFDLDRLVRKEVVVVVVIGSAGVDLLVICVVNFVLEDAVEGVGSGECDEGCDDCEEPVGRIEIILGFFGGF
jgi:hypothetical protein